MPLERAGGGAATLLVAAVILSGCGPASSVQPAESPIVSIVRPPSLYHGTLLDPPVERPDLYLTDTAGQLFALANRPDDEVTVIFFGYTHCPDVCPTTMADLAAARGSSPPSSGLASPLSS